MKPVEILYYSLSLFALVSAVGMLMLYIAAAHMLSSANRLLTDARRAMFWVTLIKERAKFGVVKLLFSLLGGKGGG